jgi:cephalosporin-C deacetylase-like acetyl esterase
MTARPAHRLSALVIMGVLASHGLAAEPVTGTVRFDPADDDRGLVPDRYRLPARSFDYTMAPRHELRTSAVDVYDVTFPSPVNSGIPENDTVYAEYFVPRGPSKFPGVIILDILDGATVIPRGQAVWLGQHGVASLFVYMAHYGPRKAPGSKVRLLSTNIPRTVEGIRQTALDCRLATAWLAARPEIDPDRLGLVGTSLGSLVGANVVGAEPRLKNVCLLLPGGGLVDAYYDHPKAKEYRPYVDLLGGKRTLKAIIAPIDPITYAPQLKTRNVLMIAASRDDIIPPSAAVALWEASGKPKIIWVDSTHVGAASYTMPALRAVTNHVKGESGEPRP